MSLCQKIIKETNGQYVFSASSIWLTLAAFAERAGGSARQELFEVLGLPEDECSRHNYYQLGLEGEKFGLDVSLPRTRLYLVDESIKVSDDWLNFANNYCGLTIRAVPMKRNPQLTAVIIREAISSFLPSLDFKGDSVLLDSLDYKGLWNEAFPETRIFREPFHDNSGNVIGAVDMMRTRKRIKMKYDQTLKATIAEIPVGHNAQYRFIFAMGDGITEALASADIDTLIELLTNLNDTRVPIEIAIPRFVIVSELDVRTLLESIGVESLWTDPMATGNITSPPASPSTFIQRVTATIENRGAVLPQDQGYIQESRDDEFIANRPFMFCLLDDTYTVLFSGGFSQPTYK
ncbi:serine protease inhibitor 77Ba-like [Bombyx mandarina]|uniref:Serine protease inhibitor 77Ba-like n=1 Tax=Bombyx mandarina TaxID=7092 RepID=A0A6J2JNL5_BOMMA|nr:serine protease inhibitor 77Ba-like [Bombyx mandarina]